MKLKKSLNSAMIQKKLYRCYIYLYGSWRHMGIEVAHGPPFAKMHFRKRVKKAIDTAPIKVVEAK